MKSIIDEKNIMTKISSKQYLDNAFKWLKNSRKYKGPSDSIWHLSYFYQREVKSIRDSLLKGLYCFAPVRRYKSIDASYDVWEANDALVLKSLSYYLKVLLSGEKNLDLCTHLEDHGGLKGAIARVSQLRREYKFVIKTDVANYYSSIDHKILMKQLKTKVQDRRVLSLIKSYLERVIYDDGNYKLIGNRSIPRSSSLSPLIGAIYLEPLDLIFKGMKNCAYVRYMDDIIIFCNSRYKVQRILKQLYGVLDNLKLKVAVDKTYIGKSTTAFNFLGYKFTDDGLLLAKYSKDKFKMKLVRLYKKNKGNISRCQNYILNYLRWAKGGLRSILVSDKFLNIIFNLTCSKSKFLDFIHYLEGSDSLRVG